MRKKLLPYTPLIGLLLLWASTGCGEKEKTAKQYQPGERFVAATPPAEFLAKRKQQVQPPPPPPTK